MRSETPGLVPTFLLLLGFALLAMAAVSFVRGEFRLTNQRVIRRADDRQAFFGSVALMVLIAIPSLIYGLLHFAPGG